MCGISGEIRFDGQTVDPAGIHAMNNRMRARGPDDAGVFCVANRAFGHRRLMIMDLSPDSQQPMFDPNLGLGIVFNGAIYNYPELRETLSELGYRFYSEGDTEVILKAYHAWGPDCLQRFNGMFAFAIWERDSGRTFLARDRLGIKPLYYTQQQQRLRFASSLPALFAAGDVDTGIDPIALNYYLNFHAVVPAPHYHARRGQKLPPGHYMSVDADGRTEQVRYWRLDFTRQGNDAERSFDD
ncbi:MAG: hypothetical protein R3F37_05200 [Candidatus Competibacteraceae bacterium]